MAAFLEGKDLSPQSRKHLRMFLQRIYNTLRKADLFAGSLPTDGVDAPRVMRKAPAYLRAEDVRRFLACAPDAEWQEMCAVAVYAGLRRGEIFRLTVDDVDTRDWVLSVTGTKTDADRVVAVHPELRPYVLRAIERRRSGLLWPGKGGNQRSGDSKAADRVAKMCARAGIPKVTFHALRHTWASHLTMSGANPSAIEAMGWSGGTGKVRVDVYQHLSPVFLNAELAKLHYPEG